jgi:hypothetical protein
MCVFVSVCVCVRVLSGLCSCRFALVSCFFFFGWLDNHELTKSSTVGLIVFQSYHSILMTVLHCAVYYLRFDAICMFQSPPTSAASAHIVRVTLARFTPQLRRAHSHCLALRQEYVLVCTSTRTELQSCAEFNSQTLREIFSALQHAQTQRQQRWTRTLQREQRLMDFAQREHVLRTGLLRTAFIAPYTSWTPTFSITLIMLFFQT